MNKINYDEQMKKIVGELGGEKKTLLLHSCCGPCSTAVIERLEKYFDLTVFYFNPNITESEEYRLRLDEQKRFLSEAYGERIRLIEGDYRARDFFDLTEGLEKEPEGGARCVKCFKMRLDQTAKVAAENGFDFFCSTLTVSPHKNPDVINRIGEKAAAEFGSRYLPNDFKKENGFKRSIEISNERKLYRQRYCGCIYSKYERIEERFL